MIIKRISLALVALVALAGAAIAQQINALQYAPLGYQQITSLGTAQALTVPAGAKYAVIISEAQAVRYRDDGTAPTASVGQPLAVSTQLVYSGRLSALRFIEQTAGAKLNVLYYK